MKEEAAELHPEVVEGGGGAGNQTTMMMNPNATMLSNQNNQTMLL